MFKILPAVLMIILVASFAVVGHAQPSLAKQDNKVRVIADSDEKASAAKERGCDTVRETKGLKAMLCAPETAAELGLREDVRVFKTDSGANSQIGANTVQSSGNKGEGRKLVILDTGYNYNHPELASSYIGGKDFVNHDNDPMDDDGHGSHVAGLITADGAKSSAKGAAPAAKIIAGKVLDQDGSGYFSDVIAAIYWAVDGPDGAYGTTDDFKADAINLSMGTGPPYLYKTYCDNVLPELTDAIKYARNNGIVVVVAAGNYGSSGVSLPGCISYSFTVGAVNYLDKVASFSGRGKGVDISAPGTNLESSWLGTSYYTASGTSMATPIITATIALVKHDHPGYSATKAQQAITSTALDLGKVGRDNSYGYGRVVASSAVDYT